MAAAAVEKKSFRQLQEEWIQKKQQNNELYTDTEFVPNISPSIVYNKHSANGSELQSYASKLNVRWERAPEIARSHGVRASMVVQDITLFDLNQGFIGNCWYIAGATHLAERDDLYQKIVPDDQDFEDRYAGIFHFNLWHFGEWVEVIIDDYLPCFEQEGKLTLFFIRNYREPGEFWSPLLEKAYAKLYGSYEALVGGFTKNSMVDITGGVGFYVNTGELNNYDELYEEMKEWIHRDTLFGSGITVGGMEEERADGLIARHAYTITELFELEANGQRQRLIRLRNPHGDKGKEWNGAWSDKDTERWNSVPADIKGQLLQYNPKDGEFWMPFDEFARAFNMLEVCFVPSRGSPSDMVKPKWNVFSFPRHAWVKGETAGGPKNYWSNPQFRLELSSGDGAGRDILAYISLMKVTSLWYLKAYADHVTINFDIYRMNDDSDERLSAENNTQRAEKVGSGYKDDTYPFRELTKEMKLKPGKYCVIPKTAKADEEAWFLLRLATDQGAMVSKSSYDPLPSKTPTMPEIRNQTPIMQILIRVVQCLIPLCLRAIQSCRNRGNRQQPNQ